MQEELHAIESNHTWFVVCLTLVNTLLAIGGCIKFSTYHMVQCITRLV